MHVQQSQQHISTKRTVRATRTPQCGTSTRDTKTKTKKRPYVGPQDSLHRTALSFKGAAVVLMLCYAVSFYKTVSTFYREVNDKRWTPEKKTRKQTEMQEKKHSKETGKSKWTIIGNVK